MDQTEFTVNEITQQYQKRNFKWLWIVLTIIITGGLVGGGTYYFLNKKSSNDKNSLQAQVDDLNKRIEDTQTALNAALQTSAGSKAASSTNTATTSNSSSASATTTDNCLTALSLTNLENAAYAISGNLATDSFKMSNGNYTKGSVSAILDTTHYACDSTTKNDVATIFKYNDGGTGWIYYLETLSPYGSKNVPTMTALATLGDRVVIKSISMKSGLITVNMLTQGPNDSAAEPTQDTVVRYKLPTSGVDLIKQ